MAKNTMQLQEKLQEEILQREEAHSTLETFRQDVGNVSQAILDLENKIDSFQKRSNLKEEHNDEIHELQVQIQKQHGQSGVVSKIVHTAAVPDIWQQNEIWWLTTLEQ